MEKVTSNNRINKNEIRNWRRKFNGATKRFNSAEEKLEAIDKLIKKSITSTKRKTLQAQRIELLKKYDAANVDLQLSKQRVNYYLDNNKKIDSAVRTDNRRDGNVKLRVGKLSFSIKSFLKTTTLPDQFNESIATAIRAKDIDAFGTVLSEQLKSSTTFKYKLPDETDEVREPLLIVMMNWFKSRLDVKTEQAPEVAPVIA